MRGSLATSLGILSLIFWSTTIALTRSVSENFGALTGPCFVYLLAGILGVAFILVSRKRTQALMRLPAKYVLGCGAMFVIYMVCFSMAVGGAKGRQQVLEVAIINYLWPNLMLVFAIPILGMRARVSLVLGVGLGIAGMALAITQSQELSASVLLENLRTHRAPYLWALVCAVIWALYSNLSRLWARGADGNAVPFFLLASALALGLLRLKTGETALWTTRSVFELILMAIFPALLGYQFWDIGMQKGRIVLLGALSFFIPVSSTFVSAIYLPTPVSPRLWIACGMVTAAAIISKCSIMPQKQVDSKQEAVAALDPPTS